LKLNPTEINVLLDALGYWEDQHIAGEVMSTVFSAILSREEGDRSLEAWKAETVKKAAENAIAKKQRHEIRVMLEAKLLQMRTEVAIEDLTS
jgi:hypothetical protein